MYPELASEYAEGGIGRFNYPRPISEPPSPSSSRHTTPAASVHGSDDEDEVDDEKEVNNSKFNLNNLDIVQHYYVHMFTYFVARGITTIKWKVNKENKNILRTISNRA